MITYRIYMVSEFKNLFYLLYLIAHLRPVFLQPHINAISSLWNYIFSLCEMFDKISSPK